MLMIFCWTNFRAVELWTGGRPLLVPVELPLEVGGEGVGVEARLGTTLVPCQCNRVVKGEQLVCGLGWLLGGPC